MCYLMKTFRCPSDILITSWLFTAWWSTWPGNHLVPCVAELGSSCIRCLPDPKCLFYPSSLSLCLSVDHFCLVPVDHMVAHGMVCDGWIVSYTALPCPWGSSGCSGWLSYHVIFSIYRLTSITVNLVTYCLLLNFFIAKTSFISFTHGFWHIKLWRLSYSYILTELIN